MKNYTFTLLVFFSFSINLLSQEGALKDALSGTLGGNSNDIIHYGTTMEEYNYLTKGYKIQMESGLDMKKGYSFIDYGVRRNKNNPRNVEVKGLVRDGDTLPCAYLMIARNDRTKKVWYLCIPGDDSAPEIWDKVHSDIYKSFSPGMSPNPQFHGDYMISLMKIISQINR